jgi:hypothetical protein
MVKIADDKNIIDRYFISIFLTMKIATIINITPIIDGANDVGATNGKATLSAQ